MICYVPIHLNLLCPSFSNFHHPSLTTFPLFISSVLSFSLLPHFLYSKHFAFRFSLFSNSFPCFSFHSFTHSHYSHSSLPIINLSPFLAIILRFFITLPPSSLFKRSHFISGQKKMFKPKPGATRPKNLTVSRRCPKKKCFNSSPPGK